MCIRDRAYLGSSGLGTVGRFQPGFGTDWIGSIANIEGFAHDPIPVDRIARQLGIFASYLGIDGHLVITHDSNQDGADVIRSYTHPSHASFGANLMYRIARDLDVSGGFNPAAWVYRPVWHAEKSLLAHTVVATETQAFNLGGYSFIIRNGESFTLCNSYKYPVALFTEMTKKAGYDTLEIYQGARGCMTTHVLRYTPDVLPAIETVSC